MKMPSHMDEEDSTREAEPPVLYIQFGHSSLVSSVSFSPDSRYVLTGSWDTTARLWEVATGREVLCFEGLADPIDSVDSVAFSPDGRYVLTGRWDKTARLWELTTGQEVRCFKGHGDSVASVAFSPDGCYVLTGSGDKTARLWDMATGREIRCLEGHAEAVTSVKFSPDGRHVLTGSLDKTARLWDVATGREIRRLEGHVDGLYSVAFSSDGRQVLTGSGDMTARLWEIATGRELQGFTGHAAPIVSVAFSPDDRQVLTGGGRNRSTGSWDKTARQWDVATGRELRRFEVEPVVSVASSPDGRQVLTGSEDGIARLWEVATGREVRRLEGYVEPVYSSVFSSNERHVFTISRDKTAQLWDVATGREVRRYTGDGHGINCAAFSPDGCRVLIGLPDKTARLWEVATGREMCRLSGHTYGVACVAFSPDGHYVITGSGDHTARLWEVETGHEVRRFDGYIDFVNSLAFSPDGRQVLAGGNMDKTARLWDVTTGSEIRRFEGHANFVNSLAFSPDGRQVLTGSVDMTARLWDVATGREVCRFEGHAGWIDSVAFSPNGQRVLTGSWDYTARLWEAATGREVRRFDRHTKTVHSVAFSPDGRVVITGSDDGTTRFWNAHTAQELAQLVSFTDGTWVVVKPDSRFDTNNLEEIKGAHWIMPDDPLHALPLEIFMRDYYEPRLLPRTLAEQPGIFKPLPPLGELNRVQPKVKIVGVRRGDSAEIALVNVEVAEKVDNSQKNGKTQTAVYDLRLFRDEQLVGQWPEAGSETGGQETIEAWRKRSKVPMVSGSTKAVHTFAVRLASRDKGQAVRFSAYAFNEDRVKSETAVDESYTVPADITSHTPRAYVLTIGVNTYDNPRRTLRFAVADAQVLSGSLAQIPGYEVVAVSLISDTGLNPPVNQATKANIRTMLQLLAGKPVDRSALQGVANAEKIEEATPDDVVIVTFSGHGHTERDGRFYLVPADSGTEDSVTEAALSKFVSSEELSTWLHGIDAGEMALVIDACHSAASVEAPGFKPGPMGDRGLGQLAYDEGMQILAATQADDVALESERLEQGLLSYALVRDGLGQKDGEVRRADLDGDGRVTLQEWLQYGEKRVPDLYVEIKEGRLLLHGRDIADDPAFSTQVVRNAQTPSLFDFHRRTDSIVLVGA